MIRRSFAALALFALVAGSQVATVAAPSPPAPSPVAGTPAPRTSASPLATASPPDRSPEPRPADATASPAPAGSANPVLGAFPSPSASSLQSLFGSAFGNLAAGASPQAYATFVRGAVRQTGLIDIVKKDDDVYFDLDETSFGKQYLIAPVLASGVTSNAFAGRVYDPFLISFKRVGKRILWLAPNPYYTAPPNSAALASLQISTSDSILTSTPILAEDTVKHRVIIQPNIFLTDFLGVGRDLGRAGSGTSPVLSLFGISTSSGFSVDTARSYYQATKALPRNDELTLRLTFAGPATANVATVPDARGVPVSVHYSILEKPAASSYVPRYGDDRVGYFLSAREDFANDNTRSPFERYINRWDLSKGPIVFYITKEVPQQYRSTVRRAILAWNGAFAKIGHPNAIEVRDQPNDPSWDPDDVRYSVVRWLTSDNGDFAAYSPSIADPETGQILRAEVVLQGESLRSIKRGFVERIVPLQQIASSGVNAYAQATKLQTPLAAALAPQQPQGDDTITSELLDACDYEGQSAVEASVGGMALRAANAPVATTEKYAKDWLYSVVLHEVGHTLGLRHNFMAGDAYSLAEVNNKAFTEKHGLGASVMAYNPTNLAPSGKPHGDYFQMVLGPYDDFAIRYGYQDFGANHPADETTQLRKLANETSRRDLRYATDEDALGNAGLDPRVALFTLSSDPLGYDRQQYAVVDELTKKLDAIYPRDDRPFADERAAFITLLNEKLQTTELVAKYIGGTYTSRDHRGQPGGVAPFINVPRSEQHRAFELLADHVLSSKAFVFPPALLNDLSPNRYYHWNSRTPINQGFPVYEVIATIQDQALDAVLSPISVQRVANAELRATHPGDTTTVADLFAWTRSAIFDDLGGVGTKPIAFSHRELQRRYINLLGAIALLPTSVHGQLDIPYQTETMARYTLMQINHDLNLAVAGHIPDVETRAHLLDLQERTHQMLAAQMPRSE
jgi:hypothetical protein